jgi:hypothetical protein
MGASVPTTNEEPAGVLVFVGLPDVDIPLVQPAINIEPAARAKIDGRKVLPSILGRIESTSLSVVVRGLTETSLELGTQKQRISVVQAGVVLFG